MPNPVPLSPNGETLPSAERQPCVVRRRKQTVVSARKAGRIFEVKLVSMEISIEYFMGVEPVLK